MAYLIFDDSLKVDNKIIDREHETLIEYINLLQRAVENETSDKIIEQVLNGLANYTETHFFMEEEMMLTFEYPDYKAHKQAHEGFKDNVNKLILDFETGNTEISEAVMDFVKNWLTEHILKVDRKLSDFLSDKHMR